MLPPSDPIDRRRFLAALAGLAAVSCTPAVNVSEPSTTASTGDGTTTTDATTTTDNAEPDVTAASTTEQERVGVEPLDAPPLDLDADPFVLGVASGDPTATSVVLWTRLVHDDLAGDVQIVWDIAVDDAFETVLSSELVTALANDAHTVRVIAEGLTSARHVFYRFRAGAFTSPTGRTKTMPDPTSVSDPVSMAFSSCQLLETGHFAAHRDIADADLDVVVWLGDYIYEGGGSSTLDGRTHSPTSVDDLDGYRARYAQYRSDPNLRAAHAAHPWMMLWDDHEVVNDYDAAVNRERRFAAYKAWWEHMPTRLPPPTLDGLVVYRTLQLGALATFVGLDVRQYASTGQLLGDAQWTWLDNELRRAPGAAVWTIVGSPVLVSGLITSLDIDADPLLPYTFDGVPTERERLAELLAATDSVVVSGDLHTGMVLDMRPDPRGPTASTAAPEFMAPAISSAFPPAYADRAGLLPLVNPQMREIETINGWLRLDVTADDVTATYRHVADVREPASAVSDGSVWEVRRGSALAERLT